MMLLAVVITACTNTTAKRITLPDGKQGLMVTCDGRRTNWDYCYDAAAKACPSGYEISDEKEIENEVGISTGISRSLYFKCD